MWFYNITIHTFWNDVILGVSKNSLKRFRFLGVAFPVGAGTRNRHLVLQVHYMHAMKEKDYSGVEVFSTIVPQSKTAATLLLVTGGAIQPQSTGRRQTCLWGSVIGTGEAEAQRGESERERRMVYCCIGYCEANPRVLASQLFKDTKWTVPPTVHSYIHFSIQRLLMILMTPPPPPPFPWNIVSVSHVGVSSHRLHLLLLYMYSHMWV